MGRVAIHLNGQEDTEVCEMNQDYNTKKASQWLKAQTDAARLNKQIIYRRHFLVYNSGVLFSYTKGPDNKMINLDQR